jgi:hypothetical protein
MLPPGDARYLNERGLHTTITTDGGHICVIIKGWVVPPGYNHTAVDLLLRLSAGYPDIQPDMWWVSPRLTLANGSTIPATEITENYLGRDWQRWSRHLPVGQWRAGVDGLESYLTLVRGQMIAATGVAA